MKRTLLTFVIATICMTAMAVGPSGMYQYSVALTNYISTETGKAPTAYLWVPEKCKKVKAVMFAQQNMTEETLFKMESFKRKLTEMDVALLWVAPWFSQKWDPMTSCQSTFDDMMTAIAYQSGHMEIAKAPVIPFGHSAQAHSHGTLQLGIPTARSASSHSTAMLPAPTFAVSVHRISTGADSATSTAYLGS